MRLRADCIMLSTVKTIRADLHIHTLLSPCGDLEMSPANIIRLAREKQLDMIGITDHNSTRHCRLTRKLAEPFGIAVLAGVEITTREEVHCLAFFDNDSRLDTFQEFIERKIIRIPNRHEYFGYQVVLDEEENIVDEIGYMLGAALDSGVEEVEQTVHGLQGLFILAHVDRPRNSIMSQLGFIPEGLESEAIEISYATDMHEYLKNHPELRKYTVVRNSDAHYPADLGRKSTLYQVESASLEELRMALKNENGRKTMCL